MCAHHLGSYVAVMSTTPTPPPDRPSWYEIRLAGHLDPRWSARFEGLRLTTGDGCTVLTGPVVDQAALHGVLHQLRDIGLPLVSVNRVDPDDETRPPRSPDTSRTGA
jgi:hypothetical protein